MKRTVRERKHLGEMEGLVVVFVVGVVSIDSHQYGRVMYLESNLEEDYICYFEVVCEDWLV